MKTTKIIILITKIIPILLNQIIISMKIPIQIQINLTSKIKLNTIKISKIYKKILFKANKLNNKNKIQIILIITPNNPKEPIMIKLINNGLLMENQLIPKFKKKNPKLKISRI
jgi:hypothetical protein